MRSALRTFASALGVCAACYLLSTASCQQVLLLFMVASFGWCWFAFSSGLKAEGSERAERAPRMTPRSELFESSMPLPTVSAQSAQPAQRSSNRDVVPTERAPQRAPQPVSRPQPVRVQPVQRVQKVYRFPIHELTRPVLSPLAD